LVDFARELTKDIDGLDNFEHGHLPYVVILLHYLEQWKAAHDGKYPATYKEKTEFRKMVQSAARTDNPEGGEENFEEAAAAVLKTLVPPSLPSGLKEVFEYEHSDPVRSPCPCASPPALAPAGMLTRHGRSSRDPASGSSPTP
jgi:amyloid beta precursor protein binding protein 1